jgi:DeoR/GlpR family transcriptional regulator of sugar metabolism
MALSGRGPKLILIGGELRRLSETLVGPLTAGPLDELHFDTAFMGTMGVTIEHGLTTSDPGEAFTKQRAMKRARRAVLLADSGKVGHTAFAHAGPVTDIHVFITDRKLPAKSARLFRKLQVQVIPV